MIPLSSVEEASNLLPDARAAQKKVDKNRPKPEAKIKKEKKKP